MRDQKTIERVSRLHPKYKIRFDRFITEAEEGLNTTLRVAQGFRTFDEQQAIYNQPIDHKDNDLDGKIDEADERVTNAPAGKSYHNYGLAVDLVEIINGKPNWKFNYNKLLPFAQKYGIDWGGLWKNKDLPHFQLTVKPIKVLYKQYLNKDFIPGTQYLNL